MEDKIIFNKDRYNHNEILKFEDYMSVRGYKHYRNGNFTHIYKKFGISEVDDEYAKYEITFKRGEYHSNQYLTTKSYYITPIITICQSPSELIEIKVQMQNKINNVQELELFAEKLYNLYTDIGRNNIIEEYSSELMENIWESKI